MTKVIIEVQGGIVQTVHARNKNIEVEVIDWDNAEQDEEYERWAKKRYKQIENSKTYKHIY